MVSSTRLGRSLVAIAATALLAASACGGSDNNNKSCSDACANLFSCAAKLNFSPSDMLGSAYATQGDCVNQCNAGTCANKQATVNCTATVPCNNLTQVQNDAAACFTNNQCSP